MRRNEKILQSQKELTEQFERELFVTFRQHTVVHKSKINYS